ncbi:MAG: hypothetical protein ACKER6_00045 [Candidatus Hodgkinia cicadicola]
MAKGKARFYVTKREINPNSWSYSAFDNFWRDDRFMICGLQKSTNDISTVLTSMGFKESNDDELRNHLCKVRLSLINI